MEKAVLKLQTKTTLRNFEKALRNSRCYLKGGWQTKRLELDLSVVEYIDIGVLARLSSLLENFRGRDGELYIRPPSDEGLQKFDEKVVNRKRKRRKNARRFCEGCGLFTTIVEAGFPIPDGITYYPSSSNLGIDEDRFAPYIVPRHIPCIIPLRWLTTGEFLELKEEWFTRIIFQISQGGQYLTKNLAVGLSHSFFEELLENVEEHAFYEEGKNTKDTEITKGLGGGIVHLYGFHSDRSDRARAAKPEYGNSTIDGYINKLTPDMPIVRLVVADSGLGIARTIERQFAIHPKRAEFEKISKNKTIQQIHFAISKYGSRHTDEEIAKNPKKAKLRGFIRLEGFINTHKCLLYIRTGNVATGFFYGDETKKYFELLNLPYIPGTVIELILPVEPRQRSSISFQSNLPKLPLNYHILPFDPRNDHWLKTLKDEINALPNNKYVIFLLPAYWHLHSPKASNLFDDILKLRRAKVSICLMIPYQDSKSIKHNMPKQDDEDDKNCILVGASDGIYSLYGGSGQLQQDCQNLINDAQYKPKTKGNNNDWLNWLIENNSEVQKLYGVSLEKTKEYLEKKIDYSSVTQLKSLEKSFINNTYIKRHQRYTTPLCSFIFAAHIPDEEPEVLFYEKGFPEEIIDAVARQCHTKASKIELNLDNVRKNLLAGIPLGKNQNCAYLTTLIRSGYSAVSCLKFMARHDYKPVVCFTIYDHRSDSVSLDFYNRKVSVVSFLKIKKTPDNFGNVDESSNALESSLISNRSGPLMPTAEFPGPLIPTAEFIGYAEKTEAVFILGHYKRKGNRHVSLFPPIDSIFNKSCAIQDEIKSAILDWLTEASQSSVDIYTPETDVEYASVIAGIIKSKLEEKNINVTLDKLEDRPIKKPEDRNNAIFLDWGSVTSSTIREALKKIADAGYGNVKLIILTSQMSKQDEDELFRLRKVTGYKKTGEEIEHGCDVKFTVVADMPFPIYSGDGDCKHCSLCKDLEKLQRSGDEFLKKHIEKKLSLFKDSDVNKALKNSRSRNSIICFGEQLNSKDTIEIVRLRVKLLQATTQRKQRDLLYELFKTEDGSDTAKAWIRLIASDPGVVHEFPLDKDDARKKLAEICIEILKKGKPSGIHWAASAALRSSSKHDFIRQFPSLIAKFKTSQHVSGELLLGLWSYLQRDYHKNNESLEPVICAVYDGLENLNSMTKEISALLEESLLFIRRMEKSLSFILRNAKSKLRYLSIPDNPMKLISHVSHDYCDKIKTHHRIIDTISSVIINLDWLQQTNDEESDEESDTAKKDIARDWQECESFIRNQISPYLKKLTPFFEDLQDECGCEELPKKWWSGVLGDIDNSMEELSSDIAKITEAASYDQKLVKDTVKNIRNLYSAFFLSSESMPNRKAYFVEQIANFKCKPVNILREVERSLKRKEYKFDFSIESSLSESIYIFCHNQIFQGCMVQLLKNAVGLKHRDHNFKKTIGVLVELVLYNDYYAIKISNNGTMRDQSQREGRGGIRKYQDLLQKYDAKLEVERFAKYDWSFTVQASFIKWR